LKILSTFEPIRQELEAVEDRLRRCVEVEEPLLRPVLSSLLDSGGKRIRPALVILGSKFHEADEETVVPLAASVELLHTATLVHDDLLDGAVLRRGSPTLNTSFRAGAVVLVGDYLFARAADQAAATASVPVVTVFAQTLMSICGGELRQAFDGAGWRRTKEDYYQSTYSKTASLFTASAETGAIVSGAPERTVRALREYGYNLGMAFQILDDILDFTGDEKELGKPIGSDLRQRTATLPLLLFLEIDSGHDIVSSVFDEPQAAEEDIQTLIEMVKSSPAIASARAEAERFTAEAKNAIRDLPASEYRQVMLDLADYLLDRRE